MLALSALAFSAVLASAGALRAALLLDMAATVVKICRGPRSANDVKSVQKSSHWTADVNRPAWKRACQINQILSCQVITALSYSSERSCEPLLHVVCYHTITQAAHANSGVPTDCRSTEQTHKHALAAFCWTSSEPAVGPARMASYQGSRQVVIECAEASQRDSAMSDEKLQATMLPRLRPARPTMSGCGLWSCWPR